MKQTKLVILLMALFGCNHFTNEIKGVDKILSLYGGQCKYSVGIVSSINETQKKYLELELSNSETLEEFKDIPNLPASNIASICYENLGENAIRYNQIRSVLIFNSNRKESFTYTVNQLKIVSEKMPVVGKVVEAVKRNDIKSLKILLAKDYELMYDKESFLKEVDSVNSKFGQIKEFRCLGFEFRNVNDIEILHISGVIQRTKIKHQFSVDLDTGLNNSQILAIQYKF